MKNQAYQLFLETLQKKVPNRKELIPQLMELLYMEKETVYRRLRQEVMFTFPEIDLIAKKYQISLDEIIGNQTNKDLIFYLLDYDFVNTSQEHLENAQKHIEQLNCIKNDKTSEIGFALNTIPLTLVDSKRHGTIYLFTLYKWMYQYGKYIHFPLFKDFKVLDIMPVHNDLYRQKITQANYTYYVLDERMIESFVRDVLYFKNIGFINKDEIEVIKKELHYFINDIEQLTLKGTFPTGKRVDFFVTQMTIESSYSYIESEHYNLSYIKLFNLNDAVAANPHRSIPRFKEWLQSLKKSSSQISVSGELQRIQYFYQQRTLIEKL